MTTTASTGHRPAPPLDAWAAQQVVLAFTAALDRLDADEMIQHFAVSGVWRRPDGDVAGHDGIREFVANLAAGTVMRHVVTNTRVATLPDCRLQSESYFTVYIQRPGTVAPHLTPSAIGRYLDTLERRGPKWVIVERVVQFDLPD
ncbi:nuclear transport factor 2 family protein [Rhodococcus artemisiae]|uniref:Nuclear transport factor 2 family protein n=1 Tax=Rhodococcus artemisiae TaxID=714159 RepID=A0ABU7L940_9NOCA|nr:nuclear transport factor 2 family protein [Rhodococcus artemisiae]MEE2058066.1 nuclear transport factor 2 family protein [Rhodococcus artemisiae]